MNTIITNQPLQALFYDLHCGDNDNDAEESIIDVIHELTNLDREEIRGRKQLITMGLYSISDCCI